MREQSAPMVRAQLLLTPLQRRRLERIAQQEGRTLSDVTRRALDIGLDALEGQPDEALRRDLQVLAELDRIREEVKARCGVYQGDLIAEVREEHSLLGSHVDPVGGDHIDDGDTDRGDAPEPDRHTGHSREHGEHGELEARGQHSHKHAAC